MLTRRIDWGGYWRGTNGTNENNICPLSFEERWSLDQMCMHGYTVAGWTYVQFWASDLHHRLFHTPAVGEGLVDHYADDYGPAVELATTNPQEAVRNTHSLAMFALDVYAYDIAAPGQGCTGVYVPEEEEEDTADTATATADAAVTTTESSAEVRHGPFLCLLLVLFGNALLTLVRCIGMPHPLRHGRDPLRVKG